MSKKRTEIIKCPHCNQQSEFVIWDSINTLTDPQMKQLVRNRTIFEFTCPNCGKVTNIDYSVLYHQMEDKLFIYYAENETNHLEMEKYFANFDELAPGYTKRIVASQNALIEKLRIFDAELDDRIIEILKVIIMNSVLKKYRDLNAEDVLFLSENGKYYFEILSSNYEPLYMEMSLESYKSIADVYGRQLLGNNSEEVNIDYSWAIDYLEALTA